MNLKKEKPERITKKRLREDRPARESEAKMVTRGRNNILSMRRDSNEKNSQGTFKEVEKENKIYFTVSVTIHYN